MHRLSRWIRRKWLWGLHKLPDGFREATSIDNSEGTKDTVVRVEYEDGRGGE